MTDLDFTPTIYSLRQIDLTQTLGTVTWLGNKEGKGLPTLPLFCVFLATTAVYWAAFGSFRFCLRKYGKSEANQVANYMVSIAHAILAMVFTLNMIFVSCDIPGETMFSSDECFA